MALKDGLQAYWNMQESGGTRFDQFSSNDLTENGIIPSGVGPGTQGLLGAVFDGGAGTFLDISDNAAVSVGNIDKTWAGWVYMDTNTARYTIFSKWTTTGNQREYLCDYLGTTTQEARLITTPAGAPDFDDITSASSGLLPSEKWFFMVVWHDSDDDSLNMQLNNETIEIQSAIDAGGIHDGTTDFRFGSLIDNTSFNLAGRLSLWGIWNRVLSSGERTELYNSGEGQTYPFIQQGPSGFLGGYLFSAGKGEASGILGGFTHGVITAGPAFLGGFVLSRALIGNDASAILGGYMEALGGTVPNTFLGGYLNALPLTLEGPAFLGGFTSGLFQNTAHLGGYMFGHPTYKEFAETHGRILTTANSEDVVDQFLNIDAEIIFKGQNFAEFNSKLNIEKTDNAEFNAKLKVVKFQKPPLVTITNVELLPGSGEVLPSGQPVPNFDPNGCRRVRVTASGMLREPGTRFIHGAIDFAEPVTPGGKATFNASISGFSQPSNVITSDHVYCVSGIYCVTARFQDNKGMVGMDVTKLNLSSGLAQNDIFSFAISGIPRVGQVPPQLFVDYTTVTSGVDVNGKGFSLKQPTDRNLYWSFGNRELSKKVNPKTAFASPGLYASVARYLYSHPSGQKIWAQDSLRAAFLT